MEKGLVIGATGGFAHSCKPICTHGYIPTPHTHGYTVHTKAHTDCPLDKSFVKLQLHYDGH